MKKRYLAYLACLSAGLFSFYDVFQLSLFNVISKNLITSFSLTHFSLGLFSASFLLANAIWLIPGGFILDNKSPRLIGIIFFSCAICATYILAISNNILICTLARTLQGVASAMSLLLCIRIATMWFTNAKGLAIGSMLAMASLGGVSANYIMPSIIIAVGWRHALALSGNVGLLLLIIMICFLTTPPKTYNNYPAQIPLILKSSLKSILSLGIYIGFMTLPIFILGALWGNLFLETIYHLPSISTGSICAFLFFGMIIGTPIIGRLNDTFNQPFSLMAFFSLSSALITILLILDVFQSIIVLKLLFFMLGVLSSSSTIAFALLANSYSLQLRSTVIAIAALIENLIGSISQPLFGWLIDIDKMMHFSNFLSYQIALMILPLAFLLCYFIGFIMNSHGDLTRGILKYDTHS